MTDRPEGSGGLLEDSRSTEELERMAAGYGCELVVADDNHLLLDLDGIEAWAYFWRQVEMMHDNDVLPFVPGLIQHWTSRGGEGRHVVVELFEPLPLKERVLLQALLGSDRVREALAWMRAEKGIQNPIVLFRPRGAVLTTDEMARADLDLGSGIMGFGIDWLTVDRTKVLEQDG